MTEDEEVKSSLSEEQETGATKSKKPGKPGIIYLSTIPAYMNVLQIREFFSSFGPVGRVYLQVNKNETRDKAKEKKSKKRNAASRYTEGWVEFENKSVAKKVARLLNNTHVDTRKRSKHYDSMWNIKYLSGFKWTHLYERLAYEKAVRRKMLRAEIQLAKKKGNFFSSNAGKAKKQQSVINKELQDIEMEDVPNEYPGTSSDRRQILNILAH